MHSEIWLVRHGETAWSLSGAHTGQTDIPLTANGEKGAIATGALLAGHDFGLVLSSPLSRARRTCELAGFGGAMQLDPNLEEWNYGDYEGLTTPEIQKDRPGWSPFVEGFPNGETIEQVATRAQKVIDRALAADGNSLFFAHGHIIRILAATWLGIEPNSARLFALSPSGVSVLGYERETRVINRWNLQAH